MYADVRGIRLFYDTEGPQWQPVGGQMLRRPTLLLLHGGPGIDHTPLRALGARLAADFHVVYLDQRSSGRSDAGPVAEWHLDSWAQDVRDFCDTVGIEKPIVLGHSFGGYVAQAYASTYPGHASRIILAGTSPRFDREACIQTVRQLGGEIPAQIARSFFAQPMAHFADYLAHCYPYYARRPVPPEIVARMLVRVEVADHFVGGEMQRFDLRATLAHVTVPVLILSGGQDLIAPESSIGELKAALTAAPVTHAHFAESGHELFLDEPERTAMVIRNFAI